MTRTPFFALVLSFLALVALSACSGGTGHDDTTEPSDTVVDTTPAQCAVDTDCLPANDCLIGRCAEGVCAFDVAPDPICCTADGDCDDGSGCSTDTCVDHRCVFEKANADCCEIDFDCDDANACTTDTCGASGCEHEGSGTDCCVTDADCDDFTYCTADVCVNGACFHSIDSTKADCTCTSTADCDDQNPCTMEACLSMKCSYTDVWSTGNPPAGCCRAGKDTDCDDAKDYTTDQCKNFTCQHVATKACSKDVHCDDGDYCTQDVCATGHCTNPPKPLEACCATDAACTASNPCLTGACKNHTCVSSVSDAPGCCEEPADCDDGIVCTTDSCNSNVCSHATTDPSCCTSHADCADTNPCTIDNCINAACQHMPATACCSLDSDCNDNNVCTTDHCVNGAACTYDKVPGCCSSAADCDDGNACTTDVCGANGCQSSFIPNCCVNPGQCNDNDACTVDACDTSINVCVFTPKQGGCKSDGECPASTACMQAKCLNCTCVESPVQGCCLESSECDDNDDVCTTDTCTGNKCVFALTAEPNCCLKDADCTPPDACKTAKCTEHQCVFTPKANCCLVDDECDDVDDVCTLDTCVDHKCAYAKSAEPGCCLVPADCATDDWCLAWTCEAHLCASTDILNCCHVDTECDDPADEGDVCTTDHCVVGSCVFASTQAPDCCTTASDCVSLDVCQKGACGEGGACTFSPVPNCCHESSECDDADECTTDTCAANWCKHAGSGLPGCCEPFSYAEAFEDVTAGDIFSGPSYPDWTFVGADAGGMGLGGQSWQVPSGGTIDIGIGLPITMPDYRFHGGEHALYYGNTVGLDALMGGSTAASYMPGASIIPGGSTTPPSSTATSPEVALPEGQFPTLHFWVYLDIESDPARDLFTISLVSGDVATVVWDKTAIDPTEYKTWKEVTVDASSFAGRTVTVLFSYDAVIAPTQPLEGLYVDDLSLAVVCP
jgi:hypothetical protein